MQLKKKLSDPKVIIHMNDIDQIAKVDRGLYDTMLVEEYLIFDCYA